MKTESKQSQVAQVSVNRMVANNTSQYKYPPPTHYLNLKSGARISGLEAPVYSNKRMWHHYTALYSIHITLTLYSMHLPQQRKMMIIAPFMPHYSFVSTRTWKKHGRCTRHAWTWSLTRNSPSPRCGSWWPSLRSGRRSCSGPGESW